MGDVIPFTKNLHDFELHFIVPANVTIKSTTTKYIKSLDIFQDRGYAIVTAKSEEDAKEKLQELIEVLGWIEQGF